MRNATYLGLCWAMTLGLVAVALGQQQLAPPTIDTTGSRIGQPSQAQQPTGLPAVFAPASAATGAQGNAVNEMSKLREQPTMPAPDVVGNHPAASGGQRRGELGVWMGETGGPGVRILRVAAGSAAEQAGLRAGDVILQVNGRGATSPHSTATLIRQIAIGEAANLTLWRDGNQQQLQVPIQPVREMARQMMSDASHKVGFGRSDSADSDWASRTTRLEQQINSLTQELATLRQEMAQLRTAGPVQTGFNAEANQSLPPQAPQSRYNETPKAAAPTPTNPASPPPGFGVSEEKPAKPASDAAKLAVPPAPAAEKPSSNDLFTPDAAQPKNEGKPKADDKGGTDDLFK